MASETDLGEITVTATPIRPRVNRPPAAARVVETTNAPPAQTLPDALQKSAPINSILPSVYAFTANVFVDGVDLGPPVVFEVSCSNFYQGDKFYTELALAALPPAYRTEYWSDGEQKTIEIRCGLEGTPQKSLIIGLIDDSEIDWLTHTIRLRGRDLSSLLADNKTAEKFTNQTASQVATTIATRRGLSSKVTTTTRLIGTFYQREHAHLTGETSEHQLLTFLAEQEGFNYWIEGRTLHFEKQPAANTKPFVITFVPPTPENIVSGNFINLTTKRAETLAKDIEVKVVSFSGKGKKQISATAKRRRTKSTSSATGHTASGHGGASNQVYSYFIPGLTQEAAQKRANELLATLSKHERNLRIEMPFDPVLDARSRISLRGTGTAFDQPYYVDSIEYSASFEAGSRMEINAKNTSPLANTITNQPVAADLTQPWPAVPPNPHAAPANPAVDYYEAGG